MLRPIALASNTIIIRNPRYPIPWHPISDGPAILDYSVSCLVLPLPAPMRTTEHTDARDTCAEDVLWSPQECAFVLCRWLTTTGMLAVAGGLAPLVRTQKIFFCGVVSELWINNKPYKHNRVTGLEWKYAKQPWTKRLMYHPESAWWRIVSISVRVHI